MEFLNSNTWNVLELLNWLQLQSSVHHMIIRCVLDLNQAVSGQHQNHLTHFMTKLLHKNKNIYTKRCSLYVATAKNQCNVTPIPQWGFFVHNVLHRREKKRVNCPLEQLSPGKSAFFYLQLFQLCKQDTRQFIKRKLSKISQCPLILLPGTQTQ